MLKNIINKIVKRNRSIGFHPQYLSKICTADLVIDVGVGYGTNELYEAYPNASIILVEPLAEEYSDALKLISGKYYCEIIGKALGSEEGTSEINFSKDRLQKASLFTRTNLTKNSGEVAKKTIQVTTLDNVLRDRDLSNKTIMLKIDTEGGELSVLKGATQTLKHTECVIAEVNLAKRFENSYEFEELVFFMSENGFKVYSFLSMSFSVKEPRQRFTDVLFKKME